jgi:heat shock protein HslJ
MMSRVAFAICLATCAAATSAHGAWARSAGAGAAWLDLAAPPAWNDPSAKIPRAPAFTPDPLLATQCARQVRPAASAADRAVVAAGWKLMGASQRFGGTEIVGGQSAFDGMCRPLGYQFFVFAGGRMVGTISPEPMDSRTDGAAQIPQFVSAGELVAVFSRYAPSDPLCCPSRVTTVQYRLEKGPKGQVLVATGLATTAVPGAPSPIVARVWQLLKIQMMDDTVHVPDDSALYTLELGNDGRASVRADCNRGNAPYTLEGRSLTFGPFATTRAMCPPGSISDRYLQQLGFVASHLERDGKLHLATRADGSILEFRPAPGPDGTPPAQLR